MNPPSPNMRRNNFLKRPPFSRLNPARRNGTAPPVHNQDKSLYKMPQSSTTKMLKPFSDDPEFSSIRDNLYINIDFSEYNTDKLEAFSTYLREYSLNRGIHQDYDEAQKARDLGEKVASEISHRNTKISSLTQLSTDLDLQKNEFSSKWEKKLAEYDDDTMKKRELLHQRLSEEKNKFEDCWNSEMPRKYRKPTVRLLQLKKIEKSYAVSGNFAKAKNIHVEVENLARNEMKAAQENLIRDYEVAQKKLEMKQMREIEIFEESRRHNRSCLIAQQESELSAIVNRDMVVQKRSVEGKKPKSSIQYLSSTVIYQASKKSEIDDVLLPPLKPPNDPKVKEEQMKKKRELEKMKFEYQKKNAEETLKRYAIDAQQQSSNDRHQQRQQEGNKMMITEVRNGIRIVDRRLLNDQNFESQQQQTEQSNHAEQKKLTEEIIEQQKTEEEKDEIQMGGTQNLVSEEINIDKINEDDVEKKKSDENDDGQEKPTRENTNEEMAGSEKAEDD